MATHSNAPPRVMERTPASGRVSPSSDADHLPAAANPKTQITAAATRIELARPVGVHTAARISANTIAISTQSRVRSKAELACNTGEFDRKSLDSLLEKTSDFCDINESN